jgi:hypothetical protein
MVGYRDGVAEPDLDVLLDTGPFAAAFRVAIRRRGLTLERLREHLARRGLPVALASLSDWQQGRRRPRSARSLLAVDALEEILNLPPSSLIRLLVDPASGAAAPVAQLGRGVATHPGALAELLDELPGSREHTVDVLSTHEKVAIDGERHCAGISSRTVVRARQDGVDRHVLPYHGDPGCDIDRIRLNALENCRPGRVLRHPAGVMVAELLFDRALRAGETWVFESRWTGRTGAVCTEHAHRFPYCGEQYLLEVRFAAAALPVGCHVFAQSGLSGERCATAALTVNRHHAVHLLAGGERPGLRGIAWEWPPRTV